MISTNWGEVDTPVVSSCDDRIELIDNTAEAREEFGKNYGTYEFRLTREQVEGVLAGKVVAFDINGREYSGFMSVKK